MTDLQQQQLDTNVAVTQTNDGGEEHLVTAYFEDYLYRIFQDINDLNDEIEASGITGGTNLGIGVEIFVAAVANDLTFRTLISSDGSITITQGDDEIDLVGQAGDAVNLGAGAEVFAQKNIDDDLEFRTLLSSDASVDITQNDDDLDLSVVKSEPETLAFAYDGNGLLTGINGIVTNIDITYNGDDSVDTIDNQTNLLTFTYNGDGSVDQMVVS